MSQDGKGIVLVTGANGYIAASTVEAFLDAGYSVRGTVRSKSSANGLVDALSKHANRLEIVEVPDITVPGAFDEAVKGVAAIAHLAAPVSLTFTDPEPVLKGAIEGTLRALEAAHKEPSVKSFVLMSSIAAIASTKQGPYTFTEADWDEESGPIVAKLGKDAPGGSIYRASKTASEKTLWKFRDENKPSFTVTSVNPTFVAGPPVVLPSAAANISPTTRIISSVYSGVPLAQAGIPGAYAGYVDIRDVARLVVFGVEHPEKANNERFIAASAYVLPQGVADILRKEFPERADIIEKGTPGEGYPLDFSFPKGGTVYDGTKAVRVTGQEYIPWEQTVLDTIAKLKPVL